MTGPDLSARSFLKLTDLAADELLSLLDRAEELKVAWDANRMPQSLQGERIALWSYGNGFRNRLAFEIGLRAMGARVVHVPGELGVNEPLEDIGHYLANWFTMLVVRCGRYEDLAALARDATVPVINARTALNHPCEILGDLQYIRMKRSSLTDLNVLFVGEVNNLSRSWFEAAEVLPIHVTQLAPPGFLLPQPEVVDLNRTAAGTITTVESYEEVTLDEAEVLYTDCWPKEADESTRALFRPLQITRAVVDRIADDGMFLPCPPVTRGEETSADALTSPKCQVYQAKECLLHAQNALAEFLSSAHRDTSGSVR
jgi:ornithine carbamoyltransferase